MDVCDIHAMLMALPSYRRIELSIHDHIPLGKLATNVQRSNPALGLGELTAPPLELITRIVVPAGSEDDLNFVSNVYLDTWYMRKFWISQAPRLLDSGIATGVKLDDLLIDAVDLSMRLHYPAQHTDPPSNMPYLFVSSPIARFDDDGTVWIDILPPDQRYYWSFDPLGEEQLGEDPATQLSLPELTFEVFAFGYSWTTAQYDLLRKFHEIKGIN
ncbi:hypothetical protein B0H17DRAFT_1213473 [Mycena rosella]|uniref:Uncharacterized protein n=1 Tax=Mycena rosella TaxID=1033263 RepID=A0AAD7G5F8_MYCRO|nr:hypothetical protein B0H17DRAFT_1213473 [Mycena rosella]